MILSALFRLAFASAPQLYCLTSHHIVTRRPVLQKVRHQTVLLRSPLSACKHTVSGSLSLPSRGSFHRSLTVLFAIGHMVVFSLMGWSPHIPSEFLVFRRTLCIRRSNPFAYGPVTLFGIPFQISSTRIIAAIDTREELLPLLRAPPLSLATTHGIVLTFFSSGY